MPYDSEAQRERLHEMGEEGKINPAVIQEWDAASSGKTLPDKVVKGAGGDAHHGRLATHHAKLGAHYRGRQGFEAIGKLHKSLAVAHAKLAGHSEPGDMSSRVRNVMSRRGVGSSQDDSEVGSD